MKHAAAKLVCIENPVEFLPAYSGKHGMLAQQEYAITSDEALTLTEMPGNSIVIVGAGYISVEFASIFRGFGADVHLMYRKPLPLTG